MSRFHIASSGLTLVAVTIVSGCGGSGTQVTSPEPEPTPMRAPPINQAKGFEGPLVLAGKEKVTEFIKNGVFSATTQPILETTLDAATPAPATESRTDFSTTNTQESGVDEADRVEYDGEYMYLATQPQWNEDAYSPAEVRVLKRADDASLNQVNTLSLDGQDYIDGIYLAGKSLAVLSSSSPYIAFAEIAIAPWQPGEQAVVTEIFDIDEPESAVSLSRIEIDGWLLASRRIGDQLYLATSYVPSVDNLKVGATEQQDLDENYATVQEVPVEQLMPDMTIDGNSSAMVDAQECYIPEQAGELDGYAQLVMLTRINLSNPDDNQTLCLSTYSHMLYMSSENLYLATDVEGDTGFHKVSLENLDYEASGSVTGQLGWRGSPNLRVGEQGEYLRVVSSDYSEEAPLHKLTVLQQQGNILTPVAQLPNEQQSEAIGKPGEDVYAVRFAGDKAYIVTFETIDPLYVLDLSDNLSPAIEGSLEIPGFSSYLHPMENGLLLGVGQNVSVAQLPADGSVPVEGPVLDGVKISLFDVRDPKNPSSLSTIDIPQSFTPVEFDYRALSVLNYQGQYQFAMPVERWGSGSRSDGAADSTMLAARNSLLLLGVDSTAAEPTLTRVNELSPRETDEVYVYGGNDRSVIQGNNVYYIHGNSVWLGQWSEESELVGPY